MQHLPVINVMRRALREAVCERCPARPPGSERWGPATPRACELLCPVFVNLPRLKQIAKRVHAHGIGPYEHAVRDEICQHCRLSPTSGDYCAERSKAPARWRATRLT